MIKRIYSYNLILKIRIILKVLFLSSILSITIHPILAMNLDGSKRYHPQDKIMFYPSNNGKLYCKALSYVRITDNDIFYKPIISKLSCPSKAYVEILCREDLNFNKKDYIILSCFPNEESSPVVFVSRYSTDFSECSVTKKDIRLNPKDRIPNKSIKCPGYNNATFYLDNAFYINRVMDY